MELPELVTDDGLGAAKASSGSHGIYLLDLECARRLLIKFNYKCQQRGSKKDNGRRWARLTLIKSFAANLHI